MNKDEKNYIWRWCLVGNIIEKHPYGEEHEIRYGSKHFSGGTKVYIAPALLAFVPKILYSVWQRQNQAARAVSSSVKTTRTNGCSIQNKPIALLS